MIAFIILFLSHIICIYTTICAAPLVSLHSILYLYWAFVCVYVTYRTLGHICALCHHDLLHAVLYLGLSWHHCARYPPHIHKYSSNIVKRLWLPSVIVVGTKGTRYLCVSHSHSPFPGYIVLPRPLGCFFFARSITIIQQQMWCAWQFILQFLSREDVMWSLIWRIKTIRQQESIYYCCYTSPRWQKQKKQKTMESLFTEHPNVLYSCCMTQTVIYSVCDLMRHEDTSPVWCLIRASLVIVSVVLTVRAQPMRLCHMQWLHFVTSNEQYSWNDIYAFFL